MRRHRPSLLKSSGWPDHFSAGAECYARHRPRYPAALFDRIAAGAPARRTAWDCGTGNGQAAVALAARFDRVVATDASVHQLGTARRTAAVHYVASTAEAAPLASSSVDLVTVAQAAHWFVLDAFYEEVRRVCQPGALLALWTYGLCRVSPEVDERIAWFYREVVGSYWPPERAWVDGGYRDLPFPFETVAIAAPDIECEWKLADLAGYVSTWSAVKRYRDARGQDPVSVLLVPALRPLWPEAEPRRVSWPLALRAGRVV